MRADMRAMQAEIRANAAAISELRGEVKSEIAELHGTLFAHIGGHSHPAKIAAAETDKAAP